MPLRQRTLRRKPLALIGGTGLSLCSVCFCLAVVSNLVSGPSAPAANNALQATATPEVVISPVLFQPAATNAPTETLPAPTRTARLSPTDQPTAAPSATEPPTLIAAPPTATHTAVPP